MTLAEYIKKHYGGNQAAFAAANGIKRQQVTQWLKKDFIVVGDRLYSHRRDLARPQQLR